LLHRNVIADNIFVVEEDDAISVKVCGLGLPARGIDVSIASPERDFRSPEEIAGKDIDVRSSIYSIGALLYFMGAGREAYQEFRARSLAGETQDLIPEQVPQPIRMVLRRSLCHKATERFGTFAELIEEIERARIAPEEPEPQEIAIPARAEETAEPPASSSPEIEEKAAVEPIERREDELMIPVELLSVAQPGAVLRLSPLEAESRQEMVVWVGNTFRIGRAADAQLVTRFLPRNKANDTQTKRLSKIHVTLRYEGRELLLSDGSGIKASANGSTFNGKPLSLENPLRLSEPGELKLADAYSIKIAPLLDKSNGASAIANLGSWNGPNNDEKSLLTGAVLFTPGEKSDVVCTLWLFSTAAFGSNSVSAIDFASSPKIAALHHFRGCFWIEQRSAEPLLLNGLALARSEIAPLAAGQTLEVKGSKYAVQVRDQGRQLKS
jgi:hypothetical protein